MSTTARKWCRLKNCSWHKCASDRKRPATDSGRLAAGTIERSVEAALSLRRVVTSAARTNWWQYCALVLHVTHGCVCQSWMLSATKRRPALVSATRSKRRRLQARRAAASKKNNWRRRISCNSHTISIVQSAKGEDRDERLWNGSWKQSADIAKQRKTVWHTWVCVMKSGSTKWPKSRTVLTEAAETESDIMAVAVAASISCAPRELDLVEAELKSVSLHSADVIVDRKSSTSDGKQAP